MRNSQSLDLAADSGIQSTCLAFLLMNAPHGAWASVSDDDFLQFVLALDEKDVEITKATIGGLPLL
jgi:hypothetical protein